MIRYNSQRQLTLEGFETPFEMNLDPSNRWVKYANELLWDDLVKVYCRGGTGDRSVSCQRIKKLKKLNIKEARKN